MSTKSFVRLSAVLLALFLGFSTQTSQAQSYVNLNDTLGTGTSTNGGTGYPAPYGNYYYGARHQFPILASELPDFCIDSIKSLAFDIANVNSCPSLSNFTIKMGHTDLSAMTQWVDGLTTVYSTTSYSPSAGWNNHTFSTPFIYNNCDNVVVEVCFNNSSWVSNGNASTRYTSTSFTSARYYRADNTSVCGSASLTGTSSNRPNMIFNMSGVTSSVDVKVGPLVAPTSACSFGSSETVSVVVQNNGSSTITSVPLAYTVNGGTAVTGTWTGSLAAGASDTFSFSTGANLSSGSSFGIVVYGSDTADYCTVNDTTTDTVGTQMSGHYTIGGSSPDYANFAAALSDLNTIGVCGPVTFHVRQGSYNEQVEIGTVSGVSSANTITFVADSTNTSAAELTNSGTYVWRFNASEYVILDGLEITQSGTSGYVIELIGVNEHITLQNNVLNGVDINSTSTLYAIVYQSSSSANYSNYMSFINNTFNDGSYGMYYYGGFSTTQYNTGLLFKNNTLDDVYYMGLYMLYGDTSWVYSNTFNMNTSSTTTQYGIYGSGGRQHNFVGNHVMMGSTSTCYGIYCFVSASSTSRSLCANNMVNTTSSNGVTRGVYISASYWDIYYNSVRTTSTSTSTSYASIYTSGTSNQLYNNAAQKDGSGYACYGAGSSFTHGNNVFYTASGTVTNFTLGGSEYNSDPGFNSTSDLYIGSFSDCYNNGTTTTLTTVDIDSNARNGSTPDIGASEYMLPEDDAGVIALDNPLSPITSGNNSVEVTIQNFGVAILDTVQVDWEVNNNAQSNIQWTGVLIPGDTAMNVNLGTYNFPSGFSNIKAWTYNPNNDTDQNMSNDTMMFTVCTGLSGTYTIGNSSSYDFASIQEAADAVMTCGLAGAVTFDIDPSVGPYTEQVYITGPIVGSSATNTITFAGGGSNLEWDAQSGDPGIVTLDNVNHIIFDSLNIESTNSTYGWGVRFANGADSNTVRNCSIMVPATTTTLSLPVVFTASSTSYSSVYVGGNGNYNTIDNNYLFGGYFGVAAYSFSATYSNTGNMITNNMVDGFYAYGLYMRYAYSSILNGNDISRLNSPSGTTFYGVYLYYGSSGCEIKNNRIHDAFAPNSSTGYGIYMYNSDGLSTDSNYIENNIIYNMDGTSSTFYGIYSYSNNYTNIQHNTLDMYDPSASGGTVYNTYFSSTHTNSTYQNNMNRVVKGGSSSKYNIYFATTQSSFDCDYNVLWNDTNSTSSYIAYYSGTQTEITNWQAAASGAYAQNSVQENPVFANPSIGDLTPLSQDADDIGTPLGVLFDIDGNSRSTTTPDAGAIEFTGVPGDVAVTDAWITQEDACYGTNDTVWVTIQNVVGNAITLSTDSIIANWSITGPVNSSGTISFNSGTLDAGNTASEFVAAGNLSLPGVYTLDVYIDTNSVNSATANDTIYGAHDESVDTLLTASPAYSYITSPYDSVNLTANSPLFPGGGALFSEITQWHASTGQPSGGWGTVSWVSSDDGVELIGAPNASLDGWTVEVWFSGATTAYNTFTFGTGAAFNSAGVAYIGWGGTAGNVNTTYNYYEDGFCANCLSSGSTVGYILKDASGNIVDVVANGTGYSWSSATGVSSADWGANMSSSSSGTSGIRRTAATDNNTGSDWIVSSSTFPQDPGTYNSTVNTITADTVTGFDWSLNSSIISTETSIWVGPWTSDDSLVYVATFDSICGTYTDTAVVVIDLTKAVITASSGVSCAGADDGTATVTASGGDSPYTYAWSDGQTTATASGLGGGTYVVTVTDNNGWPATDSVTIAEPDSLGLTLSSTQSTCGADNGSVSAAVTGGTTAYSYSWSNGGLVSTMFSIGAGSYTVTVTDANGCTISGTVAVTDAGSPTISFAVTDVLCGGETTGAIDASVSGGTSPFTYSWSNSGSTEDISSLGVGTYTLTVTDNNSCVVFADTVVLGNDTLESAGATADASCNGSSDGSVDLTITGGVTSYSYSWSTTATTEDVSGLSAGTYSVTATDAVGCTITDSYTINEPTLLTASISSTTDASCNSFTDGSSTVTAAGGTTAYSYLWSNAAASATASGLGAGTYTVTVTDANGCTAITSDTIGQPDSLLISVTSVVDVLCADSTTGEINTSTTGGTTAYSYTWSNSDTTANLASAGAGNYMVTVTDANGCTAVTGDTIDEPAAITAVDSIITPLCNGDSNASIYVTSGGGTGTLTWSWSSGQATEDIDSVAAGSYTVTITDANNCNVPFTFVVTEPGVLMYNADTVTDAFCELGDDGAVNGSVSGGTAPFFYVWSDSSITEDISGLTVGTYVITLTDTNGCMFSDSIDVGFTNPAPTVEISGDDTVCYGEQSILTVTSGLATYMWSNGGTFGVNYIDSSGVYSVTGTDNNGCTNSDETTVLIGDSIMMSVVGTNVNCEGGSDGQADASGTTGGNGAYTYMWSDSSTAGTATGLIAGVYTVTLTDAIGCTAVDSVELDFDHTNPIISLGNDTTVCYIPEFMIFNDITLTPGAGFAGYNWSTGETTPSIQTTNPGIYVVTVEDGNGCFGSDSVTIDSMICLGINGPDVSMGINIYPNPTRGLTTIEIESANDEVLDMQVMNLQGQAIMRQKATVVGGRYTTVIDLSGYAQGVYMLHLSTGDTMTSTRIVVQ